MVRALRYHRRGGPEVLELESVALPEPGPGLVRVDVKAAGLNPYDAKVRSGASGGGEPDGPQPVGVEVAGVVTVVGENASVDVGDAVFGMAAGGTSGVATAALAGPVARLPRDMRWEEAAGWPVAGETAQRGLRGLGVQSGDTVLIHGGAGVVGRFAVQLAIRAGARVIATTAERDGDDVRALGAEPVSYGDGWPDRVRAVLDGTRLDAVLDTAGAGVLVASVELAGGPDKVLTLAGSDAEEAGVRFSSGASAQDRAAAIAVLPELWAAGVRVPIAATFPLERAAEAYAALDAHEPRGKLVVCA